jgi:hypothetical protein
MKSIVRRPVLDPVSDGGRRSRNAILASQIVSQWIVKGLMGPITDPPPMPTLLMQNYLNRWLHEATFINVKQHLW